MTSRFSRGQLRQLGRARHRRRHGPERPSGHPQEEPEKPAAGRRHILLRAVEQLHTGPGRGQPSVEREMSEEQSTEQFLRNHHGESLG